MSATMTATKTAAIEVHGLYKHFGGLAALDGIELEAHAAEVLAS